MRRLFALPLCVMALAIQSSAATRQARNPELRYYADAYADHYGVPRALVHAIIAQESNWNPHVEQRRGRPDATHAGNGGSVSRQEPLFCNGKSQRGDSIPRGSHDRVPRGDASGCSRILLRFTAYRSTRPELPKSRCSVLRRSGPPPISARVARASRPGCSHARERTVTCIQSG
jgi:hypothetical protein